MRTGGLRYIRVLQEALFVIAGFFVQTFGLAPTALTYGAVVTLLALLALLEEARETP